MNLKSNKAITLVALIITIIILLILAGVTLSMVLGDNGLINKAQSSVNKYQEAAQEEQNLLQNIDNFVADHMLPPAGTSVELLPGWDGSKVDAIADGKGNTIPVPKNFYYVGGNFDNGVVISDASADEYDGITDKTTWEYTTNLVGNQFVWIPCKPSDYKKESWGSSYVTGGYDSTGPSNDEIAKVSKYGGFYVGRYEAGLADTIKEYTGTQANDGSNCPEYNVAGIPKSKAGVLPWIFINYANSKKSAENMYNTNAKYSPYVTSDLITGTQWDVMLNKFIGTTNQNSITLTKADMTDSNKWGNHTSSGTKYTGRSATLSRGPNWDISSWSPKQTDVTTGIYTEFTTGASKKTEIYHTYDVAGNVWEWTEEIGQGANYRVIRGGSCNHDSVAAPACCRGYDVTISNLVCHVGFRVVLYIQ